MGKRWSVRFPRGAAVDHPAVQALLRRGDPGTRPRRHVVGGTRVVAYSAARVYMKRDAWEMMQPGDLFVQYIRPAGEQPWAIALVRSELEAVFGEVRDSRSWDDIRCYHFPKPPPAVASFRVRVPQGPA